MLFLFWGLCLKFFMLLDFKEIILIPCFTCPIYIFPFSSSNTVQVLLEGKSGNVLVLK